MSVKTVKSDEYTARTLEDIMNNRKVPGLRNEAPPSDCYVFKANPDGSKGGLIRIEPANKEKTKKVKTND